MPTPSLYYTKDNFQGCIHFVLKLRHAESSTPTQRFIFQIWLWNSPDSSHQNAVIHLEHGPLIITGNRASLGERYINSVRLNRICHYNMDYSRRYFTHELPFWPAVTGDPVLAANVDLSPNTGQLQAPSRHALGKVDPLYPGPLYIVPFRFYVFGPLVLWFYGHQMW